MIRAKGFPTETLRRQRHTCRARSQLRRIARGRLPDDSGSAPCQLRNDGRSAPELAPDRRGDPVHAVGAEATSAHQRGFPMSHPIESRGTLRQAEHDAYWAEAVRRGLVLVELSAQ